MMRRNKKGFTLLELLICVALISVVIVFLFRLINIVRNDEKSVGYIRENQINRNQLMGQIGTIISENGVASFSTTGSTATHAVITFTLNNNKNLIVEVVKEKPNNSDTEQRYVKVSYDNNVTTYLMKDENAWYDPVFVYNHGTYYNYDYYRITFKTEKKGMDSSTVDDVEIFWVKNIGDSYMSSDKDYEYFTAPKTGVYLLEVWGAQGAGVSTDAGGYGAYASGEVNLTEGQTLIICIGRQGNGQTGGYNGGGNGGTSQASNTNGYGGGGATHIALQQKLLKDFSSDQSSLLIAAAGGGGSGYTASARGGAGGGITGVDGFDNSSNTTKYHGAGGTQSAGGGTSPQFDNKGTFGKGSNFKSSTDSQNHILGGAGGGGGFYGGGGSQRVFAGAGGGSSYISNPRLFNPVVYCYNCQESAAEHTKTISTTNKSVEPISGYAKAGNGAAKITLISREYDYEYTNSEEVFSAPASGTYLLEVWGAQGGGETDISGGYGAYAKGEIYLNSSDTIYVNVGGQPTSSSGGYNGGGEGYNYNIYNGYGGGGATFISSLSKGTNQLSSFSNKLDKILILAGGGGGSGNNGNAYGGAAGGIAGNRGVSTCSSDNYGTGGTQTAGGYNIASTSSVGSFGKGGRYVSNNYGGAGGGSGLYGGGPSGATCAGAGGGSSYIGNPLLSNGLMNCINMNGVSCQTSSNDSTKTYALSADAVSSEPMSNRMKIGNGHARITYLGRGSAIDYSNHIFYSNGLMKEPLYFDYVKSNGTAGDNFALVQEDSILLKDGASVYNIVYTDPIDLSKYNTVIIRKDNFMPNPKDRKGFGTNPRDLSDSTRYTYKPDCYAITNDIHVCDVSEQTRSDLRFWIDAYSGANSGRIYYIAMSTKTVDEIRADYRFIE